MFGGVSVQSQIKLEQLQFWRNLNRLLDQVERMPLAIVGELLKQSSAGSGGDWAGLLRDVLTPKAEGTNEAGEQTKKPGVRV